MRNQPKKEFVFGFHTITALLKSAPQKIDTLYCREDRQDKRVQSIRNLAKSHGIPIGTLSKVQCNEIAPNAVHQGVFAKIKKTSRLNEQDLMIFLHHRLHNNLNPPFLLVLDGVQDPHNLGACLRSANAAGVDAVIIPQDRAVNKTPIVQKTAAGAAEVTSLFTVTNLATCLERLKKCGIWCYGLDQSGTRLIYDAPLTGPLALVLGAEGKGLRRLTKVCCDDLVAIPMVGTVGSLNVSVAAGVGLFEVVRQRQ
ncbi:23S rRNA (guanosine(2251)-2'-O)-methyltransferase RlmB [Rickettsiella grylli]|uniref:23S rRNA (guanosine(2251)-2'-O)-methyltransferase RlmB n=1 Tax=Rickettsiella grylli TaxID=59196 RepID=UPI0008FD88DD|nr:23S rRNA (guanosine(2251)-2'-O)-methyltransferase RlmB [Rickettsiella grylli]OIZ99693.1 23S rRNA (guanosine(2251)-2'-O)-methyltransferase RlmB [Rickettsiella grylli]